jgi:predicted nucleic acid-binding protein
LRAVFADTFYWVALTNPDDPDYWNAIAREAGMRTITIFTTDEVLTEFLTFFAADARLRDRAAQTVITLLNDPAIRVIPQSRESFLLGLALYRSRSDKEYSLTDCISMQTMRREQLTEVLTKDRHFEQEGFRPLFH